MGLFNGIKSSYKKVEAAVVVKNLLDIQASAGTLTLQPETFANKLIQLVWDQKPDIFNGSFGQRPHKITVAASAIANGIYKLDKDSPNRDALVLSLGSILSEIETNRALYPLNNIDRTLIDAAIVVFGKVFEDYESPNVENKYTVNINSNHFEVWEEWLADFMHAAGEYNSQLEVDEKGRSLVDLVEHAPLKRAFRDGINPRIAAKEFASKFDASTFGQ